MCIAVFAIDQGNYPLVIAANRDEWLDRAAAPMQWWSGSNAHILAGQDLSAGGTWFAVSRQGRFGLITNIRGESIPLADADRPSRGKLILQWLNHQGDAQSFQASIEPLNFAGFNLVFGDIPSASTYYISNHVPLNFSRLNSGIHGLSNASLNTPWPKVIALQKAVKARLEEAALLNVPLKPQKASDLHLSLQTELLNSIRFDKDSAGSAINVNDPNFLGSGRAYGRRCSTTLTLNRTGEIMISETQVDGSRQVFEFSI
jgi:uncharacterized protein with NRDE domain